MNHRVALSLESRDGHPLRFYDGTSQELSQVLVQEKAGFCACVSFLRLEDKKERLLFVQPET